MSKKGWVNVRKGRWVKELWVEVFESSKRRLTDVVVLLHLLKSPRNRVAFFPLPFSGLRTRTLSKRLPDKSTTAGKG
jgi:hypothetical protein